MPLATNLGPKIQFATPVYDFGRAKSGEVVKYTYFFTNSGDQVLEVMGVQASCGCSAPGDWTKRVDPGGSGSIPVQFNSANFNGAVHKTFTVSCNDRAQPSILLQLKGTLWKPIDVAPQFAVLNVPPDVPTASAVVRIVNNMPDPISVFSPESNNRAFVAELSTNQPGKEFQVVVSLVPPLPAGNVQGQITVKTSSTNMPVVAITAWANIQPALMVVPPQIILPPGPLAKIETPAVTIQNNSTNSLAVSDPAVSAKGVEVQVRELQPGRSFSVAPVFPQGFEIPPGQPVFVTVKSSHPKYPVISIPVVQIPRPAAPPTIPVTPVSGPAPTPASSVTH